MHSNQRKYCNWVVSLLLAVVFHAGLFVAPFVRAKEKPEKPKAIKIRVVATINSAIPQPPPAAQPEPPPPLEPEPKPKPTKPRVKKKKIVKKKRPLKRPIPVKKPEPKPPEPKPEPKPPEVVKPSPQPQPKPVQQVEPKKVQPSPKTVAPPKPVPSAADMKTYKRSIRKDIEARLRYPRRAQKMDIEGMVIVSITVDRSGRVVGKPIIKRSSGHKMLDNEALRRAKKRHRPLPKNYPEETYEFVVPIVFKLT